MLSLSNVHTARRRLRLLRKEYVRIGRASVQAEQRGALVLAGSGVEECKLLRHVLGVGQVAKSTCPRGRSPSLRIRTSSSRSASERVLSEDRVAVRGLDDRADGARAARGVVGDCAAASAHAVPASAAVCRTAWPPRACDGTRRS